MATDVLRRWDVTGSDPGLYSALHSAGQRLPGSLIGFAELYRPPNEKWLRGQTKLAKEIFRQAMTMVGNPNEAVIHRRLFEPIKAARRDGMIDTSDVENYFAAVIENLEAVVRGQKQIECNFHTMDLR